MDRDQVFIASYSKRIMSHHVKLTGIKFKTKKVFSEWVSDQWSSVPKSLSTKNVHTFKERLKKNLKDRSAEKLANRNHIRLTNYSDMNIVRYWKASFRERAYVLIPLFFLGHSL